MVKGVHSRVWRGGEYRWGAVIQKKDGHPILQSVVVIDDHDLQISQCYLVEIDQYANTPKQLMVYEVLGWGSTRIRSHDSDHETGKKLSKRDTKYFTYRRHARRATFQKAVFNPHRSPWLEPQGKTKSSLRELVSLMNIVSASLQLLTRRKWTGWAMSIVRMRILRLPLKWLSFEKAGRLTDKAEKFAGPPTSHKWSRWRNRSPLTDLFLQTSQSWQMQKKRSCMVKFCLDCTWSFKAKLEAMSDDEFVAENIFPQIKAVQKKLRSTGRISLCQLYCRFRNAWSWIARYHSFTWARKTIQHIESMLENQIIIKKVPIKWGFVFNPK